MSSDQRYGDQRDEPLDFKDTRAGPAIDEETMGFQAIGGPGAETRTDEPPGANDSPGQRTPAVTRTLRGAAGVVRWKHNKAEVCHG